MALDLCALLQSTAMDGKNWDEPVVVELIMQLVDVDETLQKRDDPVKERWSVDNKVDIIL